MRTNGLLPEQALLARVARRQAAINWSFAAVGLAMFFGYVLLQVFAGHRLAAPIGVGSSVTVAIVLGYSMIVATVVLTGLYVFCNDRYVEPLLERLRQEHHV